MSQILKGIFATLAISLAFDAAQFASGHDLGASEGLTAAKVEQGVNRAAKGDRAALVPSPFRTETIALKLDSLAETSVVIRVPVVRDEARSRPTPPSLLIRSGDRKMTTVACEPVVSVLAEVAKRLQPGRCVT